MSGEEEPLLVGVHGTGQEVFVSGDRVAAASQRFEGALDYARRADTHVWVAVVAHGISDDLATRMAHDPTVVPNLDVESIVTVGISCYRCEEPLTPRRVHRRCPGDAGDPT